MKKLFKTALAIALSVSLAGCGSGSSEDSKTLKIGASPTPHAEILNNIVPDLEEMGYDVEIVEFTDYVAPNTALLNGEIDCNYFQHLPYLEDWVEKNCDDTKLVSAGAIHFEPLGIYSDKHDSVEDVPDGAKIAVPNDATNEARALQLLQANGIITLKDGVGLDATKEDVVENPHNVEIVELAAEAVPSNIDQVDFCVANGNNALNGNIMDHLLTTETTDSDAAETYANVIAVREGDEDSQKIKDLLECLMSQKTIDFINETYDGVVVPVFEA